MSLWDAEALYIGGSSRAFIILSASLLFYHMTGTGSLECNPLLAGMITSSLILTEVLSSSLSLIPYIVRGSQSEEAKGGGSRVFYLGNVALGSLLLTIELIICGVVIHDCVQRSAANR